jgi:hypothetical protein
MNRLRFLGGLTLLLWLGAFAIPATAGPEEELGPEKMALADAIVEKVIYGIRFERLRGEKLRAAIKAWTDYHGKQGTVTQREAMMMQIYVGRAATMFQQGIDHVPYAERENQ